MTEPTFVKGECPMGCGETLFLAEGGHVTCSYAACPMPNAVDSLINEKENYVHTVVFDGEGRYSIQHTLADRLQFGADLFVCPLHIYLKEYVEGHDQTPEPKGTYWARTSQTDILGWEFLPR
jgi:hypothetical protein